MVSRRHFLKIAAASGAALVAAKTMAAQVSTAPGDVMPTQGKLTSQPLPINAAVAGKYHLPYRAGFGGVAVGNGFAATTDEISQQALQGAWDAGVRYFDTSPFYGYGLSERRIGHFLHKFPREDYIISTKVGRVFQATNEKLPPSLWKSPSPFSFKYDYTAEGTRRSIEDSLQRLGISSIDIVFIHDLSPDNMGERWKEYFEIAAKGAIPELTRLREQGVIKAWGFGVNRPEPALKTIEIADPDIFLLATQYSLLDHKNALDNTFPALEKKGVQVVVGAPLLAGFLGGRDRYLYGGTIPEGAKEKRAQVSAIAQEYGIDLRTAALQFAAAPTVVSSIIPGARTAEQAKANAESMKVAIPADFWAALKKKQLIAPNAPTPA